MILNTLSQSPSSELSLSTSHPNFYSCWSNWHPLHTFIWFIEENEEQNGSQHSMHIQPWHLEFLVLGPALLPANAVIRAELLKMAGSLFSYIQWKIMCVPSQKSGDTETVQVKKKPNWIRGQTWPCLERRQAQALVLCRKGGDVGRQEQALWHQPPWVWVRGLPRSSLLFNRIVRLFTSL